MTEDDVVTAVCAYLVDQGYEVMSSLTTTQRGIDIVAVKEVAGTRRELHVEAKGSTSARSSSRRYGKPFNSGQVFDHTAKAFYKAAAAATRNTTGAQPMGAMALPDDGLNRRHVEPLLAAIAALQVGVFWISADGVTYEGVRPL